ncbi:MAG: winged helix-turn-helix domain-containing protein [Oscillospiraceae bacterium]|nr:winged helix-turn-helix domain-containing protein [Oscillospiraceae bacterium]
MIIAIIERGYSVVLDGVHIRVEMLGGFAIIDGTKRIIEQEKRSSKTWKMLQYLVTHRHKIVPQDELADVFCDDENMDSAGSALRTIVYRARTALSKAGLSCADSLIITKGGGYSWNNDIRCDVDIEEFETLQKSANPSISEEARLEILLRAGELYKGDFLPNSVGELWVMPLARWYRSMYISCCSEALTLLSKFGRNVEAEKLCGRALSVDPFDEKLIEHNLQAMMAQGRNADAFREYKRVEAMFFDVLGVNFSDNLRALYAQIQRPDSTIGTSLETLIDGWLKGSNFPGAYYCDLSEFKTIVQIESRSVPRSGRTAYVVMFETKHDADAKSVQAMKQLGEIIPSNLRMGDLFTRPSPSQYIVLLHSLTYEDCKMLVNRILHDLDSKYLPKIAGTTIKPLMPHA